MPTVYQPGDIVTLSLRSGDNHYVYELLDDNDVVFYVGRTCTPMTRLRQHVGKTAVPLLRKRMVGIKHPRMRIVAGPMSEGRAEREEKATIGRALLEGRPLLNQEHQPPQLEPYPPCKAVQYFMSQKL